MTDFERSNESSDSERRFAEQRFAELLGESFQPRRMDFEERAAFDRALRKRIERGPRRGLVLVPVVVAAAAALLWLATSVDRVPSGEESPAPESRVAEEETSPVPEVEPADAGAWSDEILDSVDSLEALYADDLDSLPEEYLAIGSVFMGFDV